MLFLSEVSWSHVAWSLWRKQTPQDKVTLNERNGENKTKRAETSNSMQWKTEKQKSWFLEPSFFLMRKCWRMHGDTQTLHARMQTPVLVQNAHRTCKQDMCLYLEKGIPSVKLPRRTLSLALLVRVRSTSLAPPRALAPGPPLLVHLALADSMLLQGPLRLLSLLLPPQLLLTDNLRPLPFLLLHLFSVHPRLLVLLPGSSGTCVTCGPHPCQSTHIY